VLVRAKRSFCASGVRSLRSYSGHFSEVVPVAGGNVASSREGIAVKHKDLKQALEMLSKVLANPSIGPDQREQLLKAKRDLETVLHIGKLDRSKIFRATETIAAVLLETLPSRKLNEG